MLSDDKKAHFIGCIRSLSFKDVCELCFTIFILTHIPIAQTHKCPSRRVNLPSVNLSTQAG